MVRDLAAGRTSGNCGAAGRSYGTYVKQVAKTEITIWSRHEEFANARVIMWFSHHVAFYTAKKVIVLPTADIAQVELLLL